MFASKRYDYTNRTSSIHRNHASKLKIRQIRKLVFSKFNDFHCQRFGAHRCGGVIISASRILTAAHCTVLIPIAQLSARAGSSASQSGGQLIQVSNVVNHPQYNPFTLNNDVSIMHLEAALDLSPAGVAVIGMPVQGAGTAAGYY